ncbi:hypothetical protein [Kribbella antiqua]|uniref:hypothetical protein n=1 Tax=Kribbella antiqua TaxID=2512217 RepID=UPI001050D8C7|nr:hypothetical protein [Kribbella antiqua]
METSDPRELSNDILASHARCEGTIDLIAEVYIAMMPPAIANALLPPDRTAGRSAALIAAVVEREELADTGLEADLKYATHVRNDLAHTSGQPVTDGGDWPWELARWGHQRRLKALPETISEQRLLAERDRMRLLDDRLIEVLFHLGGIHRRKDGKFLTGPGPRPHTPDPAIRRR